MRRVLTNAVIVLCFLAGLALIGFPIAQEWMFRGEAHSEIEQFRTEVQTAQSAASSASSDAMPYEALYQQMRQYNEDIYATDQAGLVDAFSYEQHAFDFDSAGLRDDMIGYISIERMNVELPLYIGASEQHLYDGAAVLGQTSMPLGGENTNCVIAAHRGGYHGAAMFREIETMQTGDVVEIPTPWDTLRYQVFKSIVIEPDDIDAVKIVPGGDLVTLVTCHPYGDNTHRYIVYCSRLQDGEDAVPDAAQTPDVPFEGVAYESSEGEIRMEKTLTVGGIALLLLAAAVVLLRAALRK